MSLSTVLLPYLSHYFPHSQSSCRCFFLPLYLLLRLRSPSFSLYLFPCSGWLVLCKSNEGGCPSIRNLAFPIPGSALGHIRYVPHLLWLSSVLPFLISLPLDPSLWCVCSLLSSVWLFLCVAGLGLLLALVLIVWVWPVHVFLGLDSIYRPCILYNLLYICLYCIFILIVLLEWVIGPSTKLNS